MRISEIFRSIQGESTFAGLPCTFVRLAGCNLDCTYCDTQYARMGGEVISLEAVRQKVLAYADKLVEITGGEPLLQPETVELMQSLAAAGCTVLLETNGSLPLPETRDRRCRIIMDLKTPSSGQSERMDWRNLKRLQAHDEIKFVLANRLDFDWAVNVIHKYRLSRHSFNLLFSPVVPSLPAAELADWILAARLPVRLQLQLHKILWPDKDRGV